MNIEKDMTKKTIRFKFVELVSCVFPFNTIGPPILKFSYKMNDTTTLQV